MIELKSTVTKIIVEVRRPVIYSILVLHRVDRYLKQIEHRSNISTTHVTNEPHMQTNAQHMIQMNSK